MNIVYCIPSLADAGGMERVLTRKVNYLASVGKYHITVVTIEQSGRPEYYALSSSVKLVDLNVDFRSDFKRSLFSRIHLHYSKLREYKRKLNQYLIEHPTDICISLCGKEVDFLSDLTDGSVKIAELHFSKDFRKYFLMAVYGGKFWEWVGSFRTWGLVRNVRKLDHLVVLTDSDKQDWLKVYSKVMHIYNSIEITDEEKQPYPEKTVIAVGRLEPQKGFDYLIEVWKEVAVKHPDWKLHIWGNGSQRRKLQEMIKASHLENSLFLKGTTEHIDEQYCKAYIHVVSSRYEGFSMAILEAMCWRLPSVSFDCPHGPKELIQDGENGYLVPVGDCKALSERICYLIEHEEVRNRMAEAAYASSKHYDLKKIMKQWMDLFDSLVRS